MNSNLPSSIPRAALRGNAGMTLMEVMVALSVLLIGVVVFAATQRAPWRVAKDGKICYQAANMIDQEMENITYVIRCNPDSFPPKPRTLRAGEITVTFDTSSARDFTDTTRIVPEVMRLAIKARWATDSLAVFTYVNRRL